jgi:hypothetical protein
VEVLLEPEIQRQPEYLDGHNRQLVAAFANQRLIAFGEQTVPPFVFFDEYGYNKGPHT